MDATFFLFAAVGFLAQLVDGALGMAYGVVASSALLAVGVPPAAASASTHAAKVFTTAAAAGSHVLHRNVDWRLFAMLAPAGILGGILGAYVLSGVDGAIMRPFVTAWLALMGVYILYRAFRGVRVYRPHSVALVTPMGAVGGFADAVGGGGWGPVVTTGLLGTGGSPREVIGTVNTTEFFVAVSVSAAFVTAILTGHWAEAEGLGPHLTAVLGLIAGGLCAAPLAGWLLRLIPAQKLMGVVGVLILSLAAWQISNLL